jgi:hypothetical protein
MKNLITLHEAVAIALLNRPTRMATFEELSEVIENRNLFPIRKGNITLAKQIELRTSIVSSKYKNWFEVIKPNILKLK